MNSKVYTRRNQKVLGMEVKETKVVVVEEEKVMECSSNCEDHSFYDDVVKNEVEDEVDVMRLNEKEKEKEKGDVTECDDDDEEDDVYSSSFSGTVEGDGNGLNDQEVDSVSCAADSSLPLCVRKKKVTEHWRRFVQPVMWRCKWIELKMKEIQRQAKMYDKELEEFNQAKQLEIETLKSEEVGVKALPPLPCLSQKTELKKRKKRERVEETTDVSSYTLKHNLFSYHEYRKTIADIALNDNSRNLDKQNKSGKDSTVFCEETLPLEFKEGDALLEQILLKIEAAMLGVRNLKNRVDKVVNENPTRFSSVNTEQENPLSVIKNEDEKPIISEEKSASVSSDNEQPEEDEGTDSLLSDIAPSRRRTGKGIVLDDKQPKTEETLVEEGPSRPARKRTQRNLDVEETNTKRLRVSREKPKSNAMASRFRKRKRGKRRSGSAGWRRRS